MSIINYLTQRKYKIFFKNQCKVEYKGNGYFEFLDKITIKSNVYIGPHAYWSCQGGLTIGNNVIFGPYVKIWTANHNFNGEMLPYDKDMILKPVVIKDNTWIGLNVTILPGVSIGEGSIVAAGSVVTKSFPDLSIIGGNPAKLLDTRDKIKYLKLKKEKKFYQDNKWI